MAIASRRYQRSKNFVHALQSLLIFTEAVLTVAVIAKSGPGDGRINYTFIVCWLCVPALIYQTAFPIFDRTKRFANPYAHAIIDFSYMILWFAAFVADIVWVKQGSHNAEDWDSHDDLCDKFAWGSSSRCKLGRTAAAFAAIVCVLFLVTFALSSYGIAIYRKTGSLPFYPTKQPEMVAGEDPDDHNFSSNPYEPNEEQEERQPMNNPRQTPDELAERQPLHSQRDDVSSMHAGSERGVRRDARLSFERQPTPDLPMSQQGSISWHRPPTDDRPEAIQWDRQRTPELPVGEGYYPVDTSYHGGRQTLYDPPPLQHQTSSAYEPRISSPPLQHQTSAAHEPTVSSPLSDHTTSGHLKPDTPGAGPDLSQIDTRFSWEHDQYNTNNRAYFPDADYGR
ncbi:hypothetical protein ACLMJK_009345 [Lecanora helva]